MVAASIEVADVENWNVWADGRDLRSGRAALAYGVLFLSIPRADEAVEEFR